MVVRMDELKVDQMVAVKVASKAEQLAVSKVAVTAAWME